MSVRKQEQQRLRRARQQPIIYEEDSNVSLPDPKSVPAPPAPLELDTCLDVVSTALANPNRALLRRVFFITEDKSKFVSVGFLPCPRLSAASRIRRRQETAPAPKRSTTANNGRHRRPVQRSVYKRTF